MAMEEAGWRSPLGQPQAPAEVRGVKRSPPAIALCSATLLTYMGKTIINSLPVLEHQDDHIVVTK